MADPTEQNSDSASQTDSGNEYVTFTLNDELYAFNALQVQEIIELTTVTKVPHLPSYLNGVINLRGNIIPVIDLKAKFGMQTGEYKKHTCIIVTEYSRGVMGLIVDTVSDILNMETKYISAAPDFGVSINTDFISGMGKISENLVLVLDVDRVLSEDEAAILQQAVGN